MRRLSLVLGVVVSISTMAADTQIVRGELTLGRDDVRGTVLECGTNRTIEVGVMASNQYFDYTSQFDEISGGGKFEVLVEMSGVFGQTGSSSPKLVLNHPRILAMTRGSCSNATPNTSLERTREG